jgi:hypothetical protein
MSSGGTTTTLDLAFQLIALLQSDTDRIRSIWGNLRNTPENSGNRKLQAQEVSRILSLAHTLDEEIALEVAAIALRLAKIKESPLKVRRDAWLMVKHPTRGPSKYLWLGEIDEKGLLVRAIGFV